MFGKKSKGHCDLLLELPQQAGSNEGTQKNPITETSLSSQNSDLICSSVQTTRVCPAVYQVPLTVHSEKEDP